MDLLSLLSSSASSLSAHQAASATASNNLQNVNTPGYARQRAELSAVLPTERVQGAFIGRGVTLQTVSQARDVFLEAQLPAAVGAAARSSAEAGALASVSALDPDATAGLSQQLGAFYGALRALSQNPGDGGLRQAAVAAGHSMALTFNQSAQSLSAARSGLDAQIEGSLPEVNQLAAGIADLNRQVRIARASGAEPNDLLDARLRMQDRLTELTGATPVPNANGDVGMVLQGGTSLVSGDRAGTLSALANPALEGHVSIQLRATDGSGPTTVQPGGALGGWLAARDQALRSAEQSLDTLAFDMATALNTVHQSGVGLDGGSGRDFFSVGTTAAGAAARLRIDPTLQADPSLLGAASVPNAPGDGSSLLALIATETQALSNGLDAAKGLSQLTVQFGAAAEGAKATADHEASIYEHLQASRESYSGVSIDEELIQLTRAQRAFEAVGKVITTADEMLDTLLKLR